MQRTDTKFCLNTVIILNTETGESRWEAPACAYRPMVRDYATSRLIQAWPHLDAPPAVAATTTAADGMCRACSEEPACRRCNVCASPSALRSSSKQQQRRQHNTANRSCDGGGDLCFSCYVERHAGSTAMQSHSFTVIGAAAAAAATALMCGSCG
eukprot:12514-Heterococcus_DN1.PRE.1